MHFNYGKAYHSTFKAYRNLFYGVCPESRTLLTYMCNWDLVWRVTYMCTCIHTVSVYVQISTPGSGTERKSWGNNWWLDVDTLCVCPCVHGLSLCCLRLQSEDDTARHGLPLRRAGLSHPLLELKVRVMCTLSTRTCPVIMWPEKHAKCFVWVRLGDLSEIWVCLLKLGGEHHLLCGPVGQNRRPWA